MLVLLTGKLRLWMPDCVELNQVKPGEVSGEMGVLTGHKRFAGITALEQSTALCLSRRQLRGLIGERESIYVKILETAVDILSPRLTNTSHVRYP